MDRNEFIRRAARHAMTRDPACLVTHKGIVFYPEAYTCAYRLGEEKPYHLAVLHDLRANSTKLVPLEEVEPYQKEEKQ